MKILLTDAPVVETAGLPGFVFATWSAVYAPRGTPKEIVYKLNKDFIAADTSDPRPTGSSSTWVAP